MSASEKEEKGGKIFNFIMYFIYILNAIIINVLFIYFFYFEYQYVII